MFQREVAERIVARPGSDAYGRLGVLAGWRTEAKITFDVPPQAFTPPPKVTSSVVHLVPRAAPLACDAATLGRVTQAAFGQRRKMLRQSIKSLGGEALLAKVGIDPTRRAETLSIEEFVALSECALVQLFIEKTADEIEQTRTAVTAQAFGCYNRLDLMIGPVQIFIDDDIIVGAPALDLVARIAQAHVDHFFSVLGTPMQPLLLDRPWMAAE